MVWTAARLRAALLAALACVLAACTQQGRLVVEVVGDATTLALSAVSLRVGRPATGDEERESREFVLADTPLPLRFGVEPVGGSGLVRIEAVGRVLGGAPVVESTAIVNIVPGPTRVLRMYLDARCEGILDCADDETCVAGVCERVRLVESEGLPTLDAAVDAMWSDAGVDSAVACPRAPCALAPAECGCDARETCRLAGTGTMCSAAGTLAEGEYCSVRTDCGVGHDCVGQFGPDSTCRAYCESDGSCRAGTCSLMLSDGMGSPSGVRVCATRCDVFAQTGCPTGRSCIPSFVYGGPPSAGFTDCVGPSGTLTGTGCTTHLDCAPGHGCNESGICRRWCNRGTGTPCGGCNYMGGLTVDGVEYGLCTN